MKISERRSVAVKGLVAAVCLLVSAGRAASAGGALKYVFLFIGDGMSSPQRMTAEEFSRAVGKGPLAMNALPFQCSTRTRSANAVITDSAAAATAIACGEKADNEAIGIAPDGRRLESVAEVAKRRGMKVGVMTTVPIVHATPAGFYGHRRLRSESYALALDLVDSRFDFFAGGGVYDKYDDRRNPAYRGNVFDLAAKAGYRIVRTKEAFAALRPGDGAVWGVFADNALPYAIDGYGAMPSLAEMVAKAVELLEGPAGFFIMAEGGKLDYAAHANDAATVLREVMATDEAVKVATAFAARHPAETLVITTGDHETGGMAMGFAGTGYRFDVELLRHQTCSVDRFSSRFAKRMLSEASFSLADAQQMVTESFGLRFDGPEPARGAPTLVLTKTERETLAKAFEKDRALVKAGERGTRKHDAAPRLQLGPAAKRILSEHAGVGWSSGAHTALPTLTTAQGVGAERFSGYLENSDIARRLKALIAAD